MATATNSGPVPSGGFARWWQRNANTRAAYLYLLPSLLIMAIITFYPMGYQVWMSFTNFSAQSLNPNAKNYQVPESVGAQNYADIFQGKLAEKVPNFNFWRLLTFDLLWTFTNVPVHVVLGVLIAVLLNTPGLWFKRAYRAVYVLPMVVPTLVVAAVWRNMFDPSNGAINMVLKNTLSPLAGLWGATTQAQIDKLFRIRWFDQIDAPFFARTNVPLEYYWGFVVVAVVVAYMVMRFKVPQAGWIAIGLGAAILIGGVLATEMPLSYYAMLIANIWLGWPFMTIVATGALQSIPTDLYEAASIDGASPQQQFFAITVPLIRPAMVPAAMLGIITTFNLFNFVFLMSGGGPLRKTEIMVTTAYQLVRTNNLYGMAAAFSVIVFFVLLALTLMTNTVTKGTERYDV